MLFCHTCWQQAEHLDFFQKQLGFELVDFAEREVSGPAQVFGRVVGAWDANSLLDHTSDNQTYRFFKLKLRAI